MRLKQRRDSGRRDKKIYPLHVPEVECIGDFDMLRGQGASPYEFGVRVPVATTLNRSKGGEFIAHVEAPPGAPYDGHVLPTVIPKMEAQNGACLSRIVADPCLPESTAHRTHAPVAFLPPRRDNGR